MKRKVILSIFMIMICAGLILLVRGVQEKAAVIPQQQQQQASAAQNAAEEAADTSVSDAAAADTEGSGAASGENPVTSEGSTGKAATAPAADNSPDSGSSSSTAGSGTAAPAQAPVETETKQKSSPNFTVHDTVSGTSLASLAVDISDGDTVAAVTMEALDGDCRATGSGDSIYFSRIMGISEKSAGPMSGWCFYVNGQKPGLSAGSYKLKAGDVVEWKFLKDGTNN